MPSCHSCGEGAGCRRLRAPLRAHMGVVGAPALALGSHMKFHSGRSHRSAALLSGFGESIKGGGFREGLPGPCSERAMRPAAGHTCLLGYPGCLPCPSGFLYTPRSLCLLHIRDRPAGRTPDSSSALPTGKSTLGGLDVMTSMVHFGSGSGNDFLLNIFRPRDSV